MSTNTIAKAHKEALNDAAKDLMDPSVFLGVTEYGGPSYSFQGSNFGYSSGGNIFPGESNVIDKFPFASDTNATDVGDLLTVEARGTGQSSTENGYHSGGNPAVNVIQKFVFSTDGNATDVGDLTEGRNGPAGQSSSTHGYTSGGYNLSVDPTFGQTNIIDKFPFAVDGNATDVGDLAQIRNELLCGQSSSENGYISGGFYSTPSASVFSNVIEKFPFATDTNATDIADLTQARRETAGQSSSTSGYTSGGSVPPYSNVIDKFPFASDANATDVGDLTIARASIAGQSSTSHGYTSGGFSGSLPVNNQIDKFPFASDANATDVGDLTVGRYYPAGQQY